MSPLSVIFLAYYRYVPTIVVKLHNIKTRETVLNGSSGANHRGGRAEGAVETVPGHVAARVLGAASCLSDADSNRDWVVSETVSNRGRESIAPAVCVTPLVSQDGVQRKPSETQSDGSKTKRRRGTRRGLPALTGR